MSESSLSAPRSEILQAVGAFFGYGRNQYQWTREQREQVYRCLRSGERQFYNPPGHSWSFLRLQLSQAITSGNDNYTLPDEFGGLFDPILSFEAADNRFFPVTVTSMTEILRLQQLSNVTYNLQPTHAAVNWLTPTGTTGQRAELVLYPTPNADGTITGMYYANPDATTDTLLYASGGEVHTETLLACCLAAAELERDKTSGPMKAQYQERLAASIQFDRRTGPKNYGYNSDPSASGRVSISDLRAESSTTTYNGIPLAGNY